MGQIVSVMFRGDSVDVEVHHDGGYEPDTNAHEIDWSFYGLDAKAHDELHLTDEEEQSIVEQLQQWSSEDRFDDDVI